MNRFAGEKGRNGFRGKDYKYSGKRQKMIWGKGRKRYKERERIDSEKD